MKCAMTEIEVMRVLVAMTLIEATDLASTPLQSALDAFALQSDACQPLMLARVGSDGQTLHT